MFGLASYGGEIALRIYLFMLPAACVLAACLFFPDPASERIAWRSLATVGAPIVLAGCAVVLPVAFLLARYGNEAFEQVPPGELAAANWVYAHDAGGVRLLWLSTDPATDDTPEMPWAYQDLSQGRLRARAGPPSIRPASPDWWPPSERGAGFVPDRRPDPDRGAAGDRQLRLRLGPTVQGLHVRRARRAGRLGQQQCRRSTPGTGRRGRRRSGRPRARPGQLPSGSPWTWTQAGLIVLWPAAGPARSSREFMCVIRPASGAIRVLTSPHCRCWCCCSSDVVLRFVVIT